MFEFIKDFFVKAVSTFDTKAYHFNTVPVLWVDKITNGDIIYPTEVALCSIVEKRISVPVVPSSAFNDETSEVDLTEVLGHATNFTVDGSMLYCDLTLNKENPNIDPLNFYYDPVIKSTVDSESKILRAKEMSIIALVAIPMHNDHV